jgi:hypothetical protein
VRILASSLHGPSMPIRIQATVMRDLENKSDPYGLFIIRAVNFCGNLYERPGGIIDADLHSHEHRPILHKSLERERTSECSRIRRRCP